MKRFIPNTITLCNLLSGVAGIVVLFGGSPECALVMMLLAAVFDFLDGLVARALGVSSELGKELDSLSDCVSFGVLPSLMLMQTGLSVAPEGCEWVCYSALAVAAFSALRLGMFNIDTRQCSSFIGLATPASAILTASFCVFAQSLGEGAILGFIAANIWVIPAITALICFLLVCEIPMFSMKFKKDTPKKTRIERAVFFGLAAVFAIVCIVTGLHYSFILMTAFASYIVINCIAVFFKD